MHSAPRTTSSAPLNGSRRQEIGDFTLRAARWALLIYWPLLAAATHWPNLHIDRPDIAGVGFDKWLHSGAFGGLAFLIIGACLAGKAKRFAVNLAVGAAVAFIYAPIDEVTQYFCEGREVSLHDLYGDWVGVAAGVLGAFIAYAVTRKFIGEAVAPASNVEGDAVVPVPTEEQMHAPRSGFVGAAMLVSALTFLSRITGLIRDAVQAATFGLGGVSDAFSMGFLVPNLFRRLFGEGALAASFLPVYTDLLRNDPPTARKLSSLIYMVMIVVLGSITILGELLLVAALYAHGAWDPDTALAIKLTMVMLPYMPMICLVAHFGGVLQSHGKFGAPASTPIFLNVVMIAGNLWAVRGVHDDAGLRHAAYIVGISVVIAGAVQLVWQLMAVLKHEPLTTHVRDAWPSFKLVMAAMLPMLFGLAVFQINTFMDNLIAYVLSSEDPAKTFTFLGITRHYPIATGGVAALNWSQRLYQFPLGVFGLAIATAIFPALAHAAAERSDKGTAHFRTILQHGLRLTMFIGLPASVGLILIRVPLCRAIYERGSFTPEDSIRCAAILAGYAPAIWAYSMTHVLTRGFYAMKDTRTPLRLSIKMVVLNFALNLILVWPLHAAGLAWSTAIAAMVQCPLLIREMQRYTDSPVDRSVWASWLRTAILTGAMTAAVLPITWLYDPMTLNRWELRAELVAMCAVGAVVVLAGAKLMRLEELGWLMNRKAE
ncbi:MAG: murein biosynthesis integral membrane protein MurJ [Planctomycetes bacterium]|nr:murein biosynthesis integral membrane protein MurJ [Planctomycetota bacterium]